MKEWARQLLKLLLIAKVIDYEAKTDEKFKIMDS
jgi:hypothetical protein